MKRVPKIDEFTFSEWKLHDSGDMEMPEKDFDLLFGMTDSKARTEMGKKRAVGKLINKVIKDYLDHVEKEERVRS